jgi:hypothetical protein
MLSDDNLHTREVSNLRDLITLALSSRESALMWIGGYFASPSANF